MPLEPVLCNRRSHGHEKPEHCNWRGAPHSLQVEKVHIKWRSSRTKNKKIKNKKKTENTLRALCFCSSRGIFFSCSLNKGPTFPFCPGTHKLFAALNTPAEVHSKGTLRTHSWITVAELCRRQSQKQWCAGLALNSQHGNSVQVCAQWHNSEICRGGSAAITEMSRSSRSGLFLSQRAKLSWAYNWFRGQLVQPPHEIKADAIV